MNRNEQEKLQRKKESATFNSVTQSVKVENQNQTHNVKKEGAKPKKQR